MLAVTCEMHFELPEGPLKSFIEISKETWDKDVSFENLQIINMCISENTEG